MIRGILLFTIIVSTLGCNKTRTSTTEFIVTDFSKPIEIIYQARHKETCEFDYGVQGRVDGGEIRVVDIYNPKSTMDDGKYTFYKYKGDVNYNFRPSGFSKQQMRIITLLPDSGVVGKVKIFFKEKSILINNEEHSLF